MPDNENGKKDVQECTVSKTIAMKVNGNNVTLQFASQGNNEAYKQVKKILLDSYTNKNT